MALIDSNDREQLRVSAQAIMHAALKSVDPGTALRANMRLDGDTLVMESARQELAGSYNLRQYRRVFVVGGGKRGAPNRAIRPIESHNLRGDTQQ